jgi:hypothetical protein
MRPRESAQIEGVDDALLAAATARLPTLPIMDAALPDRFSQAVRALVERRAQAGWPNENQSDVAVFVMVSHPRPIGDALGAIPIADPIATHDPLLGKLLLLNRDASGGRYVDLPCAAGGILEWLPANGLGDQPLVIAYRETKTIVTRRQGASDLMRMDIIRDQKPTASLAELLDALDHFHKSKLLTPSFCVKGVWESRRAGQYVPSSAPELRIQDALEFALNFWFHGVVRAEIEDRTNIGRIDVRLLKPSNEGPLLYWAIIELKVIKSFSHAPWGIQAGEIKRGQNIASIIEGFIQAWAFKNNRIADEGLLEIFDMRRDKLDNLLIDKTVLRAVRKLNPVPAHHVRPIFGSARKAREAGFHGV